MNVDDAARLIEHLEATTGGGWTPEKINAFIDEVRTWDDSAAAERAVSKLARTWMQTWSPPLGVLEQAYSDERAATRARTLKAGRGCDGSGWIPAGMRESGNDQYSPCPVCNPALTAVYRDPDMTARYLAGTPLHRLSDEVMQQNGVMHWEFDMPAACRLETGRPDPMDPYVAADAGRRVAERMRAPR